MKKDSEEFARALFLARKHREDPDVKMPQPLCLDRAAEYSDYPEDDAPDEQTALDMCEPCPLFELCRASALQTKPAHGVWGGIAWDDGRQVHWLRKLGIQS